MLRDFVRLARPFWTSEERGKARWTAALLAVLTLMLVGVSVILVQLGGGIFDAIQNYNFKAFLRFQRAAPGPCLLVAADKRLLRAAEAEGLNILNPEDVAPDGVPGALSRT